MDFIAAISALLAEHTGLPANDLADFIEIPPQKELGDYAFPCFKLAKTMRKAPPVIAAELSEKLSPAPDYLTEIRQTGGYLNFFVDRSIFVQATVEKVLDPDFVPGQADEGKGKTVLVEFSSPNIAKPFHIGHGFTTILGEALARIYGHLGYDVVRLNHLGDYGTQFGKLIVAYRRWADEAALTASPIEELLRIYVKFHEEAEKEAKEEGSSDLELEARKAFRDLESGKPEEVALWKRFRDLSLSEFNRVYDRLHISFDNLNGESFYSDRIPAVVDMLREKDLLEESEGAQVVRLDEEKLPPCIILKSDGTTIYASRDIAAILYREDTWHFFRNIYVVGQPQSLHFQQVFAVLRKAGYDCADRCKHVAFGTVKLPTGAMSTRQGEVIKLEDLLNEAVAKTRAIIEENARQRGTDMAQEEIDEIAEKVGLGAIVYLFMRNGRERDIVFRWEEVLDFDGDTAPYLQYTYARARSVLRQAKSEETEAAATDIDFTSLTTDLDFQVVRELDGFADAVTSAAQANEPFMIARQINALARQFNRFYNSESILGCEEVGLRKARLALCRAVCKVLKTGLHLLGIEAVERM